MAATLNLHRVFAGSGGYLEELTVPATDAAALRSAREEIRAVLRGAFRDWEQYLTPPGHPRRVLGQIRLRPQTASAEI
jgi:hypothetical protein